MADTRILVLRSSLSRRVILSIGSWGGRKTDITDEVPECDDVVLRLGWVKGGGGDWLRLTAAGIP